MSKKLVLISPYFFDYHIRIATEFENMGFEVLLFDEVYRNSLFFMVKNISPRIGRVLSRYHEMNILKKIRRKGIKNVVIIRGRFLTEDFLANLKNQHCSIIQYQWDSIANNPNALVISKYSIRNLSFDYADCEIIDCFDYLPLFYRNERREIGNIKYDISFVGSFHVERYERLLAYGKYCQYAGVKFKFVVYINILVLVKLLLLRKLNVRNLNFLTVFKYSPHQINNLLSVSRAVLDLSSPTQSGTTMRVIESLHSGIDVITSNEYTSRDFSGHLLEFSGEDMYMIRADSVVENTLLSLSEWSSKVLFDTVI